MNRRNFLAMAGVSTGLAASGYGSAAAIPDRRRGFRLKETAGLRRFGYPVHVSLPDDPTWADVPEARFRLERQGRVLPAQFRRVKQADGTSLVELDFPASPGPFEIEDYTIHLDGESQLSREPRRGMSVRLDGPLLRVSNAPSIHYTLAADLAGFVRSVRTPDLEFLQASAPGLFVGSGDRRIELPDRRADPDRRHALEVTRQGPLAIGLRHRDQLRWASSTPLASTIELTFPSSKSWIETSWTLVDPHGQVERMGLELGLQLAGPPVLWDCGAGSTVYGTLRKDELMTFEAGGRPAGLSSLIGSFPTLKWVIRHGTADHLQEFATGRGAGAKGPEGWIHLMDPKRCTAMAVAGFGRLGPAVADRFELHAGGRLVFERRFLGEKTGQGMAKEPKKTLRFWFHFVPAPVQVGAVTSPQSMLAPLEVEGMAPGGGSSQPSP